MVLRMLVVLVSYLMAGCGIDERDSDDANVSLPDLYDANIGTVEFPVSCNAEAAEMVQRGLVLMHHMMYEAARPAFGMAENLDPGCVMALWGQAMTEIHPLWADRPTREVLQRGQSLVQRARTMEIETDRERAYLETVAAYFVPQTGDSEKSRLERFEKAWRQVAERHADDLEAQAFYALAHIAITREHIRIV